MLYWNPELFFTIPFLGWKLSWYFIFFGLGFVFAFSLGLFFVYRYFLNFPIFLEIDITSKVQNKQTLIESLNESILSIPLSQELEVYQGFEVLNKQQILRRKELETLNSASVYSIFIRALRFYVPLSLLLLVVCFLGSRISHFVFYENPNRYVHNLSDLLLFYRGGRSIHGVALGLIVLPFYLRRYRRFNLRLTWKNLFDLLVIPAVFGAAFVRFGNFFTQEILGKETFMPWGIVYGFPTDGSEPMTLHPVQIYEALGYLFLGFFLLHLSRKSKYLLGDGKISGLAIVFGSLVRIFCEFFKQEQSKILSQDSFFTMGQWLSIPSIFLGLYLYYHREIATWIQRFKKSSLINN